MLRFAALALAPLLLSACASDSGSAPGTDSGDYADEMHAQHAGETPVASGATEGAAALDVTVTPVAYGVSAAGDTLRGQLVAPTGAPADLPGLIVIHEWWGLNGNVVDQARRLADQGYAALAVDLYGGETADTPDAAMALMRAVDEAAATDNLRQAYAFLDGRGAPRVGSVGWCFGGGQSLNAALALPTQLDAAVVYYGQPVTDVDRLATLRLPVLGLFGADDTSFPPDLLDAFEAALAEAGVEHEIVVYPDADHAFANPSGERYQPEAARAAWAQTTAFLAEHLEP